MAATQTQETTEALVRIIEQLTERVERLEVAVGQHVAFTHGVSGSRRLGRTPELAALLRDHEQSGRFPTPFPNNI